MMNARVKKLWIGALLSGRYEQARKSLRVGGEGYCCLGVLCDLHAREVGGSWDEDSYLRQSAFLPLEVMEWAEVGTSSGCYRGSEECSLSNKNDSGYTFEEIAQIIEKHF